jgi:hypothetical protein
MRPSVTIAEQPARDHHSETGLPTRQSLGRRVSDAPRKLVSAKEACEILRCSRSHFYKVLLAEKYIKTHVKHGRRTFFSREEIEALSVAGWR